jgi:hypothetical protein
VATPFTTMRLEVKSLLVLFAPSIKSKPGLSRRVSFSWQRPRATGRSFAPRLSNAASVVLKSMMLASPRSAAIMAFASYGLPIATLAASRHSPSSIRSWGKDARRVSQEPQVPVESSGPLIEDQGEDRLLQWEGVLPTDRPASAPAGRKAN